MADMIFHASLGRLTVSLLESQHRDNEKLLTAVSSNVLVKAKTQNDELKREYGSNPTDSLSNKRTTKTNVSLSISDDNDIYEKDMNLVENSSKKVTQKSVGRR